MSVEIVPDDQLGRLSDLARETIQPGLSHGTVRDFCQGMDLCPGLITYNGDLKDAQRFWMLKAILATQPRGATLLEIGAGEPLVADVLGRLGYRVIVVDPYEGAGNGPVEVQHFREVYRNVEYVVEWFTPELTQIEPGSIDCCYSISVIEHIPLDKLEAVGRAIRTFTKPGGSTIHAIDLVAAGQDADYHTRMFTEFTGYLGYAADDAATVIEEANADVETYFLSAESHNRWRGQTPYDAFPMRKVLSLQVVGWPQAQGGAGRAELRKIKKLSQLAQAYEETRLGSLVQATKAIAENPVLPAWHDVRLFNGAVMSVSLREEVGRQIFLYKAYEIELTRYVTETLREGDIFYDVGAHHGYFSVVAAHCVGAKGSVLAFEPVPNTVDRLRYNVRDLRQVTVHASAVGDRTGTLRINDYGDDYSAFNSSMRPRVEGHAPKLAASHTVPMTTLDEVWASTGRMPTLIKVDVESMESQVIAGSSKLLATGQPIVVLEVGDFEDLQRAGVPSTRQLCEKMSALGYGAYDAVDGKLRPHAPKENYKYGFLVFTHR